MLTCITQGANGFSANMSTATREKRSEPVAHPNPVFKICQRMPVEAASVPDIIRITCPCKELLACGFHYSEDTKRHSFHAKHFFISTTRRFFSGVQHGCPSNLCFLSARASCDCLSCRIHDFCLASRIRNQVDEASRQQFPRYSSANPHTKSCRVMPVDSMITEHEIFTNTLIKHR